MHGFLLRWWVIAAKYLVPVLLWRTWTYTGPGGAGIEQEIFIRNRVTF